jgi:hypothetical protein
MSLAASSECGILPNTPHRAQTLQGLRTESRLVGKVKTVTCQQAKLVDGGGSQDAFGEGERLGNDTR